MKKDKKELDAVNGGVKVKSSAKGTRKRVVKERVSCAEEAADLRIENAVLQEQVDELRDMVLSLEREVERLRNRSFLGRVFNK